MYISLCSAASHLGCREGTQKLTFCSIKCESYFGQKGHNVDHMEVVYSVRSSSIHPYISRDAYGILEQQWMSLPATHPHIPRTERGYLKYDILHEML